MKIYNYFRNSNYQTAIILCNSKSLEYKLIKENGKVILRISNGYFHQINDEEDIVKKIDELISMKCSETISFLRTIDIQQILNP